MNKNSITTTYQENLNQLRLSNVNSYDFLRKLECHEPELWISTDKNIHLYVHSCFLMYIKFTVEKTGIILSSRFNKKIVSTTADHSVYFFNQYLYPSIEKYRKESWIKINDQHSNITVSKEAPERFFHELYMNLMAVIQDNHFYSTNYWWFGINNKKNRGKSGHVFYSDIEQFLSGQCQEFFWPYGGSPYSKKNYPRIKAGDKAILWMGHGWFEQWGVIGFASVSTVRGAGNEAEYGLSALHQLDVPLTPYPKNHPKETENTSFLREIFGVDFKALNDVFRQVNYVAQRTTPVTIDEISPVQYKKIFARCAKKHSHDEAEESDGLLPEEFLERKTYVEGLRKQIQVSRYERNRQARKKCLEHYGTACQICGFDFKKKYGLIEKGIHIHHRKPLSEIGENYEVDPIRDLLPVCPNCHTIIHSRNPAYTIEEICILLKRCNRSENG